MSKKLRYTVRLYRLHDLDLITFAETHEFNVIRAMYSSLSAFAKGELFVIEIPPRREKRLPPLRRVYIKALTLDSEKDKDAIAVLSELAPGYRNSFLKNLLRLYLCNPLSEEFFRTTRIDKDTKCILFETPQAEVDDKNNRFLNKFEIFRQGRKMVKAGKMRNTRRKTTVIPDAPNSSNVSNIPNAIEDEEIQNKLDNLLPDDEDSAIDIDTIENKDNAAENIQDEVHEEDNLVTNNGEDADIIENDSITLPSEENETENKERVVSADESKQITSLFTGMNL